MNKTVLIVDDDPIVRFVIQKMIHKLDDSVYCHHCDNGEMGLAVLETLQNSNDTIVVLFRHQYASTKWMGLFRRSAKNKT